MKKKSNSINVLTVIVLFCLITFNAFALDPSKAPKQYGLDVWDVKSGLPAYAIHAILQTRDGYLWLATDDGLMRFDGVRFTVFNSDNTKELKTNDISALAEDRDGNLWIGTLRSGICKMRDGKFSLYDTSNGLSRNDVHALLVDSKNVLWVGLGNAIVKFSHEAFEVALRTSFAITSFYEDPSHTLWAGEAVLLRKEAEADSFTVFSPHLDAITSMIQDNAKHFWIGRVTGLYSFDGTNVLPYDSAHPVTNKTVRALLADRDGNTWIGTEGDGIFRYANGAFTRLSTKDGLSSDRIIALYEDSKRNLWIGTRGGGLIRLKDNNLETYSSAEGLADEYVTSVCGGTDNMLWVGTRDAGVTVFENGKFSRSYTTRDGLSDNQVRAIYRDEQGTVWLGTRSGLNRLQISSSGKTTATIFSDREKTQAFNGVRVLYRDTRGTLWIGSYGQGIFLYEKGSIKKDTTFPFLRTQNSYPRAILEDRNHEMWVGTQAGLNHFRNGTWEMVNVPGSSQMKDIFCLYEDTDGSILVGTYSYGLFRVSHGAAGDTVASYTKKSGLFDDVIFSILEDVSGNVWMSCNKGIFRVKKQDLLDFTAGKISSVRSISYGVVDGMKSAECNGGSQPAAWKSVDGRLWFPTVKGLVSIDPMKSGKAELPSPVKIEEVIVDDDTLQTERGVRISAGKRRFEFLYTALQLTVPQKIKFQYKLEGFDEKWNDVGTRRKAYYTNIPPGEYTFNVMASTSDGVWTGEPAMMRVVVLPHVWETWWFRFCGIALLLGIGVVVVRRREQAIKGELQKKLAIQQQMYELEARALRSQMNPHFIFNSLNAIQECILSNNTEAACEYLSKFAQLLRMILEYSEHTAVTLEQEINALTLYLQLESLRFDEGFTYTIDVDPLLNQISCEVPAMLIQPYVENAVWHGLMHKSGERQLLITMNKKENLLLCVIEDNGIGRERAAEIKHPLKKNYESKGMKVTRERLEAMKTPANDGADVRIIDLKTSSGEPAGTRVELFIPIQSSPRPQLAEKE